MFMATVTIQRKKVEQQKGLVILPLKEYQKLLERTVPTYYLTGKEAKKLDRLVERGLKEHREGKTIQAGSLKDALRVYAKRNG